MSVVISHAVKGDAAFLWRRDCSSFAFADQATISVLTAHVIVLNEGSRRGRGVTRGKIWSTDDEIMLVLICPQINMVLKSDPKSFS